MFTKSDISKKLPPIDISYLVKDSGVFTGGGGSTGTGPPQNLSKK
jgi:hypothetical protein